MTTTKKLCTTLIALVAIFGLSACGDDKAEEVGENIDEVVTDAGNAIEDACEEVKEGVKAEDKDC
ncbi:MAG: hypothetical protein Alis3KO_39550 [Aliiglaciecola sp.]|uniref:hypothetical protein n=1 Tax=Aliiglaciecola sp. M165 TaxID=2593649 RepID=UPI00117C394A|nr:hypothetical protein [Aliiglaciecola sp. M165]TRY32926.1 hypothetical protein FM019_02750 [Aliiglaciecola sp. M165]